MKLASLKTGGRDGTLIVVSKDLQRAVAVPSIAPTLQRALEDWQAAAPRLNAVYEALQGSPAETINGEPVFAVEGDGRYRDDWTWLGGADERRMSVING